MVGFSLKNPTYSQLTAHLNRSVKTATKWKDFLQCEIIAYIFWRIISIYTKKVHISSLGMKTAPEVTLCLMCKTHFVRCVHIRYAHDRLARIHFEVEIRICVEKKFTVKNILVGNGLILSYLLRTERI